MGASEFRPDHVATSDLGWIADYPSIDVIMKIEVKAIAAKVDITKSKTTKIPNASGICGNAVNKNAFRRNAESDTFKPRNVPGLLILPMSDLAFSAFAR